MRAFVLFRASVGLAMIALAGCGESAGPEVGLVQGRVTMGGEPVGCARITFIPVAKGSPSYGGTDDDGVYRLMFNHKREGAELGKHNVIIESPEPETDDSGHRIISSALVKIPALYGQPGTLTADVNSGKNKLDFQLDPQAGQ